MRSGDQITFDGPTKIGGLANTISDWFDRFDYDADKVLDEEKVHQDHKQLRVQWEAEKDVSDYASLIIEADLAVNNAKDVTIKTDQGDIRCTDCDLSFTVDAMIQTDTEGKYEGRPLLYFLRYVGEHMIYKNYIDEYEETIHEHCENLEREVNRFLNKELASR